MAANKFRKESDLILNGHTYSVRPNLDKIARIETRFGAAPVLLRRCAEGNVTQAELSQIVGIMLRGQPSAPRDSDIPALVFEQGTMAVSTNVVEFLVNAVTTTDMERQPTPEDEADEGNVR
jgi:hypothetical protein